MAHTLAMLKSRLLVALSLSLASAITFSGLTTDYAYAVAVSPASVSIAGSTPVGSTLTATIEGAWDPSDATVAYQWKRGASSIAGQTSETYVTTNADIGLAISVDVTAEAVDYEPVTVSSNAITPQGALASTGKPVISKVIPGEGSFVIGQLVTASTDVFEPAATSFTYEWRRNSIAIPSATSIQYELVAADAGQEITVFVTASRENYANASRESDSITPIGLFTVTPVPLVDGTASVGSVLTADAGTWSLTPTSFEYQWLRNAVAIESATASTYTVDPADVGDTISVRVTAKRAGFTDASQTSLSTAAVVEADFSSVGTASITNDGVTVGTTLTASASGWVPSPDSFNYQWLRDGEAIGGATASTYDITGIDRGYAITVRATAVRSGYNASSSVSASVSVPRGSFVVDAVPVITDANSGTQFAVGHSLSSSTGTFTPTPSAVSYQWKRDGDPIVGATSRTYTLVIADAGASITVSVTAEHPNLDDETSDSSAITGVGQFTETTVPTISGTSQVDQTLTAAVTGWTPTQTSFDYQWLRDDVDIEEATADTYVITPADVNTRLSVRVTAKRTGFADASRTSLATSLVGTAHFSSAGTVSITHEGTASGDTFTAAPLGWVPSQDSFEYEWLRSGESILGETESTYTVVDGDRGYAITVRATAKRAGYLDSTSVSPPVEVDRGSFAVDAVPEISDENDGTQFAVGHTLSSSTGTFTPTPSAVSYQWKRDGDPIVGATSRTYTLVIADAGASITVSVTAEHPNLVDETSDSSAITAVGQFTGITVPTISGTRAVDQTLTANISGWSPAPTTLVYAWYRDDGLVDGATEQTLTLTGDDLGHTFHVEVTGSLDGYESETRQSVVTGLIGTTWFTSTGTAVIDDTSVSLAAVLTVTNSDWVPDPDSYTYQWLRNSSPISDATDETYTIDEADLGKSLSVRVKPVRTGYESSGSGVLSQTVSVPLADFELSGLPTSSGTPNIPNVLTLESDGVFSPEPTSIQIRWLRNGSEISGATSSTYKLVAADSGKNISIRVTAIRAGYNSSTETSDEILVGEAQSFTASPNPVIQGIPQVDKTLTAITGEWTPEPDSFSYQWRKNGVAIPGETSATYDVVPSDIGARITVSVEPFVDNYFPIIRTSRATATVYAATFDPTRPIPTISGVAKVGSELTAELSGWTPEPTSVSYQWLRGGIPISGATAAVYTTTSTDLNTVISVQATPVKLGYSASPVTSSGTSRIALGEFSDTPIPTISGVVQQGLTLTAVVSSWSPVATLAYSWKREGVSIPGATSATYLVSAIDAGNTLSVSVTGSRAGYLSVTVTSDDTIVVPSRSFSNTENPTITGDAAVGGTLSVDYGSPSPVPESVTYQWLLDGEEIVGATDEDYVPTSDQLYRNISVTVSYGRSGYAPWSETSDGFVNIGQGTIGSLTPPEITGTPRVGRTLIATFGTWNAVPDGYSYQWFRDGEALGDPEEIVEGSVSTVAYPLTSDDVGGAITFKVLATKEGFADEEVTSAATSEIGLAIFNARPIPTISGVAKVANTLSASTGAWSPNPTSYTFQWTRNGTDIPSATSQTYLLTPADAGRVIRVVVNGVREGYEGQPSTSLPTVSIANAAFTLTPAPTISGTVRVGVTLSAVTSTWTPEAASSTYIWQRNGVAIPGASTATYLVEPADIGARLTVVQTGSSTGYTTTTATSVQTAAVVKGIFSSKPTPSVTGRAKIGSTLTASSAAWTPAAATLTYQWRRSGENISGATSSTYVIQPVDGGSEITVAVTASRTGYVSATKVSAPTDTVEYLAFTDMVLPTISGLEKVEGVLTASTGEWTPTPTTFTYQWNRTIAGVTTSIAGATNATYTLVGADALATISVTVTASKLGYAPITLTSDRSEAIAKGTLSTTPVPTLTGTPQVGVAFGLNAGTWSPQPVSLAYQWFLNGVAIEGATSATYTPVASNVSSPLSVRVTGSKLGYDNVIRTSAASASVVLGVFSAANPTITGAAQVGSVLTADPKVWTPATSPARTYQWTKTVAGVTTNIPAATSLTYTPVAADVGATLAFKVSGGLSGYVSATKTSASTVAVVKGTFSAKPTPTISGSTTPSQVGQLLTASVGRWTPLESAVTYQWKRNGVAIAGATGTTYTTVAADLSTAITVTATGTLAGYVDGPSTSAARTISAGIFSASPTPLISGTAAVNATLTAAPGDWAPAPTLAYQWKREGTAIVGATSSTYVLKPEDADKKITVVVTGSRAGYTSISRTSAQTDTIARIALTSAPEPVITGTAAVGQSLTATAGAWAPSTASSPVVLTYRWERGGTPIDGATGSTYIVTAADEGARLRVFVTGTKLGYITQEQPSAQTSAVIRGTFSATLKPTITGNAKVGIALTAVPGTWAPSTSAAPITFTYQWKREGTDISGATSATYTPVAADLGKPLSVSVTGAKAGFNSVTQTSDPLARLTTVAGTFTTIPKPTIAGTAKVGVELTATPGSWVPSAGSLTYQWRRTTGTTTVNIAGATAARYTPTADDQGKTLSVVATATTAGYTTTSSAPSKATAVVALGTIATPTTLPEISGTVRVGQTLTASAGATWPVGATLAYQWNRNGVAISTARASTYVLVTADLGARMTVTVTATLAGYSPKSATSVQTVAVIAL